MLQEEITSASITEDETRRQMEAILRSRAFERSERLQAFLRYICDLTLRGQASRINEYLIGSEVFHRGPEYSPHEDSIVRRQAHALRHKLKEYYDSEGREDAVIIELPVGRYVPVFRRREDLSAAPLPVPQASAPAPAPVTPAVRRWRLALGGLAIVVALAAGWLAGRLTARSAAERPLEKLPPAVLEIWRPWFEEPAGAVICFSNPMTTVIKHFRTPPPPDNAPRRSRVSPEEERALREVFDIHGGGYLYATPSTSQAKAGEAVSAVHLAVLFSRAGAPVRTTQSRLLSWQFFSRENAILLGHNEANAWLDPLLESYPFRLAATDGQGPRRIVNTRPLPGESAEYRIEYPDTGRKPTQEYALISMVPGLDGRRKLLLINGLNTQATQMATHFLTDPGTLAELVARLRRFEPNHTRAWYFQAVLKTEVRDKVPTRASLVALRVLQDPAPKGLQ